MAFSPTDIHLWPLSLFILWAQGMNLGLILFHFKDVHILSPFSSRWVEWETNILSEVSVEYIWYIRFVVWRENHLFVNHQPHRFSLTVYWRVEKYTYCSNSGFIVLLWKVLLQNKLLNLRLLLYVEGMVAHCLYLPVCECVGLTFFPFCSQTANSGVIWAICIRCVYVCCVRKSMCTHTHCTWQDSLVKVSAMSSRMTGNNEPS